MPEFTEFVFQDGKVTASSPHGPEIICGSPIKIYAYEYLRDLRLNCIVPHSPPLLLRMSIVDKLNLDKGLSEFLAYDIKEVYGGILFLEAFTRISNKIKRLFTRKIVSTITLKFIPNPQAPIYGTLSGDFRTPPPPPPSADLTYRRHIDGSFSSYVPIRLDQESTVFDVCALHLKLYLQTEV